MATSTSPKFEIPPEVKRILDKARDEDQRMVVMTCGLAGSGKSTLTHLLTHHYTTYTRLSIDKFIHATHGTHTIHYPASSLPTLQEEAERTVQTQLASILSEGKHDVVLDMAFYEKSVREEYRGVVEREGRGRYRVLLVVFRVLGGNEEMEEVLWGRVEGRRISGEEELRRNGGREGMLSIEREVLRGWIEGFEWPDGEGEVVIVVEG